MKGIKTLIKLKKKELDEDARKKAVFEAQIVQLQASIDMLQAELEKEQHIAASQPDMTFMLISYTENNKQRQQHFQRGIESVQKQVQVLEDRIRVHFSELKKYEIALEQKIKKQLREEKLREDKVLNDMTVNKYARKEE